MRRRPLTGRDTPVGERATSLWGDWLPELMERCFPDPVDTSDIAEAGEEFFKSAKLKRPTKQEARMGVDQRFRETMLITDFCRKVQDYRHRMQPQRHVSWDGLEPEEQLLTVQAVAVYLPALVAAMCAAPDQ